MFHSTHNDSLYRVLVIAVTVLMASSFAEPEGQVRLLPSVHEDGSVRLVWMPKTWDEQQVGFALFRKVMDRDDGADWQQIGEMPIHPDLSEHRLKRLQLDRVLAQRDKMIKERIGTADIMAKFIESPEELRKISFMAASDIQWAVAFGLGLVDTDVQANRKYRYRLHRAYQGEEGPMTGPSVAEAEVWVRVGWAEMPPLVTFTASRTKQVRLIALSWQVPAEVLEKDQNFKGFAVYAGDPDGPLTNQVGTVIKSHTANESNEAEKMVTYSYKVRQPDLSPIKFGLAPMSWFGGTGPVAAFTSLRGIEPELATPANLSATVNQSQAVELRWDYAAADLDFGGFVIERSVANGPPTRLNENPLPKGRRFFVDRDIPVKEKQTLLSYAVNALSADWRPDGRAKVFLQYVKIDPPSAPSAFQARADLKEGGVSLTFEAKLAEGTKAELVKVERQLPEDGTWTELCIFRREKLPYSFQVEHSLPNPVRLRCRAVRESGEQSDPSPEVEVAVSAAESNLEIKDFKLRPVQGGLELAWWTSTGGDGIRGSRIWMDGQMIADEEVLGPLVRKWRTWNLQGGKHTFEVCLVDKFGRESPPKSRDYICPQP